MAIIEKTPDEHRDEALNNLLDQFNGSPDLRKLIEIYVRQVSDLEISAFQLYLERLPISAAVGEQLDGIGRIIGEERQGRDDTDYRVALLTRINLNLSDGTRDDIILIIVGVLGAGTNVLITEYFPAGFIAEIEDDLPDTFDPTVLSAFVRSAKPVGVRGIVAWHAAGAFHFDIGPGLDVGKLGGAV